MKLQTSGIDHINLDVKNLDESVQFYCDLFGFAILKDQPKAKSKIIGNDAVKLCLYEVEELQLTKEGPGFNHFGLHIHNFKDVQQACKERNVSIVNEYEWEKSASVYIQDPNGYVIELAENFGGGL